MFEKEITNALAVEGLSPQDVESALETPKEAKMGDICLPCFKFARTMRLAPPVIANKLLPYVQSLDFVEKVEVVGGYLNIFFDRNTLAKKAIEIANDQNVGASKEGEGKTICIDYSSVNIAKPFHIGHLSTTVIGGALYRIFEHLGYNVVGINHLGENSSLRRRSGRLSKTLQTTTNITSTNCTFAITKRRKSIPKWMTKRVLGSSVLRTATKKQSHTLTCSKRSR